MDKNIEKLRKDYDEACKRILSEKYILAWIMKSCIDEYSDSSIDDIANKYIEGNAQIGEESLNSDGDYLTNRIRGMNTEDSSINEGVVRYDIKYRSLIPNTEEIAHLIINIEPQSSANTLKYPIMKRAVYYASRLISSQKGTEFIGSDYGKIKKIYSIWIFTSLVKENAINKYCISENAILGNKCVEKEHYDLLNIITVELGEVEQDKEKYKLVKFINLLKYLFTNVSNSTIIEIENILKKEYRINIDNTLREELIYVGHPVYMSYEKGIQEGIEQGIEQGKIQGMLLANVDIKKIIELTGTTREEILDIQKGLIQDSGH